MEPQTATPDAGTTANGQTGVWPAPTGTPLLVFADDWGRHPSSCQHLVRRLLPEHPTVWVNTVGTRTPKFDLATVRRGLGKVRQWLRRGPAGQAEALPAGLQVVNPRMWPWFSRPLDRRLNRALLTRQLEAVVAGLAGPPVAISTLPIVADLIGRLAVRRWVYYCVDDFSLWPGLDGKTLGRMEETVVARADVLVAASDKLRRRLNGLGRCDVHLLTHGVDLAFWRPGAMGEPLPALAGLPRPLVVFWGVVDRRMDVRFLRQLTGELTTGTVVLAGPEQDPDPQIGRLPRTVRLGSLRFGQLPSLARGASVLVMPYADLPVTRAMQPLKLKEYLATGLPVVARDLPANREWADCLDLVDSPESFSERVRARLPGGLPASQAVARKRLDGESWEAKADCFTRWALGPTA